MEDIGEMYFLRSKYLLLLLALIFGGNNSFAHRFISKKAMSMSASVIVPCSAQHFVWLSGLLEAYQQQTMIPEEVVVSLSEVERLPQDQITLLEKGLWDFKLRIIRNIGKVSEGRNRTIAMNNATGDILIFNDADDLPHPQRVEIVKFVFENYEVEHLLHSYSFARKDITPIAVKDIQPLQFNGFDAISHYAYASKVPITTGSPCFLKKVGNAIKWEGRADVAHARQVYKLFKNNVVLNLNLILYRNGLSSYRVTAMA